MLTSLAGGPIYFRYECGQTRAPQCMPVWRYSLPIFFLRQSRMRLANQQCTILLSCSARWLQRALKSTCVMCLLFSGLSHTHIFLIVRQEDRPQTADDVDAVISAELPDPTRSDQARRLHAIVVRSMVHRQCDVIRPAPACIVGGQCDKGFPKPYAAVTEWREESPYPVYRRRAATDGGQETVRDGRLITNQWVVPHSPYLSLRFDAHINVEVCCSIQSVKYLFR